MWPFRQSREDKYIELLSNMQSLILKQTEVAEAQARTLTAFLEGFKVDGPPSARVMRELDEWALEQEQLSLDPNMQAVPSPAWLIQRNQD